MINDSFEIKNFISSEDIDTLKKHYSVLKKTLNSGDIKKAFTTGFPWENSIEQKIIGEKLDNIFKPYEITISMFLEEFQPWGIHTDYFKDDINPYYACLIPLDFKNKITHTIIFNEEGIVKNYWDILKDKNYKFSNYEKILLSHIEEKYLKKVSIQKKFKWEIGNLIAWNRKLLHTSDNFIANGLDMKFALVLFLRLKND